MNWSKLVPLNRHLFWKPAAGVEGLPYKGGAELTAAEVFLLFVIKFHGHVGPSTEPCTVSRTGRGG